MFGLESSKDNFVVAHRIHGRSFSFLATLVSILFLAFSSILLLSHFDLLSPLFLSYEEALAQAKAHISQTLTQYLVVFAPGYE